MESPQNDDARERFAKLSKKARARMAEAPMYPDDPESLEEQRQICEAFRPLQLEAMRLVDEWWENEDRGSEEHTGQDQDPSDSQDSMG